MDNITHSLVGLVAADAVVRWREFRGVPQTEPKRRFLWAAALLGSNLPDGDVLYSFITEGRLGYLLHHRGHTHTFVGLLPQFLFIWLLLRIGGKRMDERPSGKDWSWALTLVWAGLLSHLFLDAFNYYGVHLLWPFDNRWFYGDTLFILEPWLWLTLSPALYLSATGRLARVLLSATFVVGTLLSLLSGHIPWYLSIPLVGVGSGLWKWSRGYPPGARTAFSVLFALVPVLIFALASRQIKRSVSQPYLEPNPSSSLVDIALTPMPANPLCWSIFTLETYDRGKAYRIRQGIYATVPSLVPPQKCPTSGLDERTATLLPTTPSGEEGLLWFGEIRNTVDGLKKLAAAHCQVAAFLKFARMPFFQEAGRDILMGDLRFDRQRGLGFSEIQTLRVPLRCPDFVPPWEEPLSDLLK